MKPTEIEEQLQVIRTVMERVVIYHRALAPVSLFVGIMGISGAVLGEIAGLNSGRSFLALWLGIAIVTGGGTFLVIRLQALRTGEPFWSVGTRKVVAAVAPAIYCALISAIALLVGSEWLIDPNLAAYAAPIIWAAFYGLGIHAAGFFMEEGTRLIGWIYIGIATVSSFLWIITKNYPFSPNILMGIVFGIGHILYAAYLKLKEKRS